MATYRLKPGHARTFLAGVPRAAGEDVRVDPRRLDAHDSDALRTHFDCVDAPMSAPKRKGRTPRLRNGLTVEQAQAKLNNAGITFTEGLTGDELADVFDRAFGGDQNGGNEAQPDLPPVNEQPGEAQPDLLSGDDEKQKEQ